MTRTSLAIAACALLAACAPSPKTSIDFVHQTYIVDGKNVATPQQAGLVCTPPPCKITDKGLSLAPGQTLTMAFSHPVTVQAEPVRSPQ